MESANKRIAYNTLFMYIRLFSVTVIGLYTSRLVLEILGVSDYGLFAVVGGVLGMFTFISGSLSGATSRFFNTEMGKKDGDVNASFNINLLLHVCLAVIIFVLAETVGLWYVYNGLNVADGKLDDAVFVYQISIITVCLGITNGPFVSLFNAHERFMFMAILDIVNSIIRLCAILLLSFLSSSDMSFPFSLLKLYSLIMLFTTANTFVIFHWVAYKDWPEVIRLRFVKGWVKYREVLSFGGWNMLGTVAYMARSSGSDLILNSFFGTAMNGAFAISKTVRDLTTEFSTKFDGASAPQIIQAYSSSDKERYTYLANKMGRLNILLFEIICFPFLIELEFVLQLWLGKVPEGAYEFTYVNILVAGVALTAGGVLNVINASGKIKWFKINTSFFFLICIPLGWLLFHYGYPAYSLLLLFLFADIIQRIIQLVLMKKILNFDSMLYVREAYFPAFKIALIMTVVLYLYSFLDISSFAWKFSSIICCFVLSSILVMFIGLSKGERQALKKLVNQRLMFIHLD